MRRVITYGTYDLLHEGHIRLLKRAKALGDYLIVGVTSDDFDRARGKINVNQSLYERIESIKSTGLADEIIIEEYEGQKIDDIRRYEIDVFTIGSDWMGKFDYLNEYCEVIYLERTEGISSTSLRESNNIRIGFVGDTLYLNKVYEEISYVNGITVEGITTNIFPSLSSDIKNNVRCYYDYEEMLCNVDAVYVNSNPLEHFGYIKKALELNKHVTYESPITTNVEEAVFLHDLAAKNACILQESLKTAYSTAYSRMLLLLKGGKIGKVVSVDSTCTSLDIIHDRPGWNSLLTWGAVALLPVFQILGVNYRKKNVICVKNNTDGISDLFSKIDFVFNDSVASIKVGKGVKSEGELIISGTKGYIYVPAPWWKLDYFEIRYENQSDNRRYFYQLDGEGIRYGIVAFVQAIRSHKYDEYISFPVTKAITKVMQDFIENRDNTIIEI